MTTETTHYYFAGGGTGGHIYPALAIADQLSKLDPSAEITFLCSQRPNDTNILSKSNFKYVILPALPFSTNLLAFMKFCKSMRQSYQIVSKLLDSNSIIISSGGFVSAPAVWAGKKLDIPIAILNIDAVPGKANKYFARFAKEIFVQFDSTVAHFKGATTKTIVTGAPLRPGFAKADGDAVISELGLDKNKRTLLVTGASSGAANINNTVGFLLDKFEVFRSQWQIIHLSGLDHYEAVKTLYSQTNISSKVLDYHDDMAGLLCASDLVLGRAGALSVAEYVATSTPSICMPYPYHRDNHQRLNATRLIDAGCGVIVEDKCDTEKTARILWPYLSMLMKETERLDRMRAGCAKIARLNAAAEIAQRLNSWRETPNPS